MLFFDNQNLNSQQIKIMKSRQFVEKRKTKQNTHHLQFHRSKKRVLEIKAINDAKKTHFTKKCPKAPTSKFSKLNPKAKFNLNPDKFLIPVLAYGPMNQMNGLFETIALSIILNRTLILPKMYSAFKIWFLFKK